VDKLRRRQLGINRARRILRIYRESAPVRYFEEFYKVGGEFEKHLIHTRVPCSCAMCGNPRKYFNEITKQEIQAIYDEKDGIEEIIGE
jgi:hypothetical protein